MRRTLPSPDRHAETDLDRTPPYSRPRAFCALLLATLAACSSAPQRPTAETQTPDLAYPALFAAVQQAQVFDDQKTFADARPLRDPQAIHADYLVARDGAGFGLRTFVDRNFDVPASVATSHIRAGATLTAHIDGLWPSLTRTDPAPRPYDSRLPLPRPYVVPGGRFREVYYWDSYFTMLGLVESGQHQRVRDMVANFAALIDRHGHMPNGARSYYLSRSQPPFFSHMVELEARFDGHGVYRRYLPQLRREHAWWMQGEQSLRAGGAARRVVRLDDGTVLNRYWDDRDTPRPEAWLHDVRTAATVPRRPAAEVFRELRAAAESGWDFSSRWLDDGRTLGTIRTTSLLAVDLNSLLHHLEATIAMACRQTEQSGCVEEFDARAATRRAAIERYLWSDAGYYTDYDWQRRRPGTRVTATALYPLFTGIASAARARQTAATVRAQLLAPGGLLTTTQDTGEQWDAPNAWAPLQWVAVDGLRRYGEDALARDIARNFLGEVTRVFGEEHRLVEKYDARRHQRGGGGEYALQDGFGWTNGVVRRLLVLYPPDGDTTRKHAPAATQPTPANVQR